MTILSGKPKHLFMVKDGRGVGEGRVVAAEQFSPEQRAVVERVLTGVGRPGGVLVGAYFTSVLWDVRPLVLEKGVMTITRFSDPALPSPRRDSLARLCGALQGVAGVIACGQAPGAGGVQLWMRRRFYTSTLGETASTESISIIHPQHLARRIISYLRHLDGLGIVHGHLSPNNVVIDGDNPIFLDYGFGAWGTAPGRYQDISPEVQRGDSPTGASDVFGLGAVLKHLLGAHLDQQQLKFLETLAASEPGNRPVIGAVEAFFSHGAANTSGPLRMEPPATPRMSSGRVVNPVTPEGMPPVAAGLDRSSPVISDTPQTRSEGAAATGSVPGSASSRENVVPQTKDPNSSAPGDPRQANQATTVLGGLLVVVVIFALFRFDIIRLGESSPAPRVPYAVFWASGQASMMQQVAEAAVEQADPEAERVIVSDILKSSSELPTSIRLRLLRVGYNPLWQHELEPVDRELLLSLGLNRLLPERPVTLPELKTLHPGVVVALAGDADLTADFPELATISLVEVAELPAPYGPAFLELIKEGGGHLGEPVSRAVSHLLAGDASPAVLGLLFPDDLDQSKLSARLKMLLPLLTKNPALDQNVAALIGGGGPLAKSLAWFQDEDLVEWEKVSLRDKFAIVAGLPPGRALTLEQSIDLVRSPIEGVRVSAARRLESQVSSQTALIIPYLGRADNKLSRAQAVALVAALEVSGSAATTFIQGWFATEPSTKAVVELLIARGTISEIDGFNVEAARYLKSHRWDFSLDQIEALARHGEPLVRAMAYSRLDVRDTAQRSILEKAATAETSPKLREQVLQKLKIVPSV